MPINQSNLAQKLRKNNSFQTIFARFILNRSFLYTVHRLPFTKKSFTLSEVLITLGIIGVIAGITIPPLMNNIQDKQFKEAAKEAFSKASQAIQQMKLDEGGSLSGYYGGGAKFKNAFMAYFKVINDCGEADQCIHSSANSTIYKSLQGGQANTKPFQNGQFITADGMLYGFWAPSGRNYIFIGVDVNGYQKGPNVVGRDVFFFNLMQTNDNIVPDGALGTDCENYTFYCNKSINDVGSGCGCMYYVMQGIDY